jgi:hypothetical protein
MTEWFDVLDRVPSMLANRTPEDVLYHYTSQKGFLGIVEKKKLWATHIRYLNDSQEFEYAIALARTQLEKERNSGHQQRAQFAERWAPAIKHGGFHEEEEWRLIAGGTRNDSRFRQGLSLLCPLYRV